MKNNINFRKIITLILIISILSIVDSSVIPVFVAPFGYYPSFLTVFMFSYAMINKNFEALIMGLIVGLLQDLGFTGTFGLNSLLNMLLCILIGYVGNALFLQKKLIPTLLVSVFSLIKIAFITLWFFLYCGYDFDYFMIIMTSIMNLVLAIFIYRRVFKLCKKDYMSKDWGF